MIELNYSNMMEEVIGANGMAVNMLEGMRGRVSGLHGQFSERTLKEFAFLDLPGKDTSEIRRIAQEVRNDSDAFLVLGIGGSALGPRAILEALSPLHNLKQGPKIFIYDNVDPGTMRHILSVVDLKRTTVNVISKSGSTAETAASFMVLWDRMKTIHGNNASKRFIATTDPVSGALRKLATEEGIRTLPVDPLIGGRYSVLTPVGLLLAEVAGIESQDLLSGADQVNNACSDEDLWKNPVYLFSILLYLMATEEKRGINVMIPYADSLKYLSEWFCQLWAESLGKNGSGMTPYPSVGTTDQHSQLQLWMEGPEDKVITFIRVNDYGKDITIPRVFEKYESMSYLSGHGLSALIKAEQESTELALAKKGKPNMTISIPAIDAYHIGQLFMFFEIATAFTGLLLNINPFNQPGVEEGKKYTYGMMGRKGFEDRKQEVEAARKKKTRWKV
jgi:glucose-6-phosphate isomerase